MTSTTACYVAIWQDRHADTTAHLFSTAEKAIAWARASVNEYCDSEPEEELTAEMKRGGWLYYGCYSCEGDFIHVIERVIDADCTDYRKGDRDNG